MSPCAACPASPSHSPPAEGLGVGALAAEPPGCGGVAGAGADVGRGPWHPADPTGLGDALPAPPPPLQDARAEPAEPGAKPGNGEPVRGGAPDTGDAPAASATPGAFCTPGGF